MKAYTGTLGRAEEINFAVKPLLVKTTMASASILFASFTEVEASVCQSLICLTLFSKCNVSDLSAFFAISLTYFTHLIGKSPTVVSADNIRASAPSYTAFATSETSALVGCGFVIIDSSS